MICVFKSPACELSQNWKNNHCGPQISQVTEVYISDINTCRSTCLDSHYAAIDTLDRLAVAIIKGNILKFILLRVRTFSS